MEESPIEEIAVFKIPASGRRKSKRRSRKSAKVLKTKESFGGGLILIGGDRVKTDLVPRPDITNTLSAHSILNINLEPKNLEVKRDQRYDSVTTTATTESDETETTTVSAASKRQTLLNYTALSLKSGTTEKSGVSFAHVLEDSVGRKRCEKTTYPKIRPKPCNQYCSNMMLSKVEPGRQAYESRQCNSKKAWIGNMASTVNLLPIYAVRVRWKMSPQIPCYTLEMVHAVLSCHGRIESMRQHTPNSAIVVFADVQTARRCIKCAKTGVSPLICTWWFPEMYNYKTLITEQSSREEKKYPVHLTSTAILNLEFLLAQKKCDIQRKSYGGLLSYNTDTFNP